MRLINTDDLMCKLTELEITNPNFVMVEVKGLLVNAPTVEERKHGHWIEHPTLFGTWVCSECGMTIYNFYKADKLYIYCPKCGAKMDGDTK